MKQSKEALMVQKRVEVINSVDFSTAQNFVYRLGACNAGAKGRFKELGVIYLCGIFMG